MSHVHDFCSFLPECIGHKTLRALDQTCNIDLQRPPLISLLFVTFPLYNTFYASANNHSRDVGGSDTDGLVFSLLSFCSPVVTLSSVNISHIDDRFKAGSV